MLQSNPTAGQAEPSRDARDRLEGPRTADDVTGSRRRCVDRWERRKGEARLAAVLMCKSILILKRNIPASHGLKPKVEMFSWPKKFVSEMCQLRFSGSVRMS